MTGVVLFNISIGRAADYLANLGHLLILGITVFEDPPPQMSDILENDCNGVTIARMVPCS